MMENLSIRFECTITIENKASIVNIVELEIFKDLICSLS